jgi:hypothetical protein
MRRGSVWYVAGGLVLAVCVPAFAQAPLVPVPVLAADMEQTVLTPDGHSTTTTTKLFIAGSTVRVEPDTGSGRTGYAEYHLYDFEHKRVYRVFPDDRIYFDLTLTAPLAIRAFVEGWAPAPPEIRVRAIPLKDEEVEGRPARLSLVERRVGKRPSLDYALVWNAVEPERLPIRVIYTQDGTRTVVVRYRNIENQFVDPGWFVVPEGFLNLSPF